VQDSLLYVIVTQKLYVNTVRTGYARSRPNPTNKMRTWLVPDPRVRVGYG